MSEHKEMDSKEFSKGRPGFDLMAMGKEAKESGLWTPRDVLHHQPPAVTEETLSSCSLLRSAGNDWPEVLAR